MREYLANMVLVDWGLPVVNVSWYIFHIHNGQSNRRTDRMAVNCASIDLRSFVKLVTSPRCFCVNKCQRKLCSRCGQHPYLGLVWAEGLEKLLQLLLLRVLLQHQLTDMGFQAIGLGAFCDPAIMSNAEPDYLATDAQHGPASKSATNFSR